MTASWVTDFKPLKVSFIDLPKATAESQIDWRLVKSVKVFPTKLSSFVAVMFVPEENFDRNVAMIFQLLDYWSFFVLNQTQ